jgi:hypothetical protein
VETWSSSSSASVNTNTATVLLQNALPGGPSDPGGGYGFTWSP